MNVSAKSSSWQIFMRSMYAFIPVSLILKTMHVDPLWVFIASGLAIVPLAGLMGQATEHLAEHMGEGIGGLLNATFGNAAELIIALLALKAGLHEVVKASITGSIIGNILLVLGVSMVAGGIKFNIQKFNATAASMGSSLLLLSAIGLVVPAIFHYIVKVGNPELEHNLSLEISVVLFATYILSLVFTLRTHKHLYVSETSNEHDEAIGTTGWSKNKSFLILLLASIGVAVIAEALVGSVEHATKSLGMTEVFVGVIIIAIIGNAAEHSTAVLVAMKNKMELAINIAIGSTLQIALFVAPTLVFASYLFGQPLDLVFTPFEVFSIIIAVLTVNIIIADGESNWMEGTQLLAVYCILGIAFYFLPVA